MKKLLVFLLFACGGAFAQLGNVTLVHFPGAASGACGYNQQAVNDATGALYTCANGAWVLISGGGGGGTVTSVSGTANQIDVATGTTTPVLSLDAAITLPGTLNGNTQPTNVVLGDNIQATANNVIGRTAAPTGPNGVPQPCVSTPSGGVGQPCAYALQGVPIDATNPATLLVTDRANFLDWTAGTALALPSIASAGFGANLPFVLRNTSTTLTVTPNVGHSDLCDGSATCTILPNFASFFYQDGVTNWKRVYFPTFSAFGSNCGDGTHALNWSTTTGIGCQALTGAVTSVSNSDGTLTISPTSGAVVASLALGHANTWSGLQTFTANCGTGTAGCITLPAGTAQGHATASTIVLEAPTSVTAYEVQMPTAAATGIMHWTNTAGVVAGTISAVALGSADVSGQLPIGNVGSSGLSGTAPITISAAGAIGCATCQLTSGTVPINQVVSATGAITTIANGNNPLTINVAQTTNSQNGVTFGETSAATNGTLTNGLANQTEFTVSTASASTATPFGVNQGSVTGTVAFPAYQIQTTWNNAGLTGMGLNFNVTDTSSAAGSLLFNFAKNNTAQFTGDKSGNFAALTSIATGTSPPACTAGTGGARCQTEGTAPTNVASSIASYADSTAHELKVATNGTNNYGILIRQQPGAINQTAQTAAITTATLCASAAGACNTAGQYHVHWNFWGGGTACSVVTAGSVTFLLTWTDENAVTHSAVALNMMAQTGAATTAMQASFPFQTALANESASGDFTFSTNGSLVQYATGYTACSTGTGTYSLRAAVTRIQ